MKHKKDATKLSLAQKIAIYISTFLIQAAIVLVFYFVFAK